LHTVDCRLLVEPEVLPFSILFAPPHALNTEKQISTSSVVLKHGMENCSLALRIPEYGPEATRFRSTIDGVWSLTADDKVNLRRALVVQDPRARH
jgi:hypothetical protein